MLLPRPVPAQAAVVIPTIGSPDLVLQCVQRIAECTVGFSWPLHPEGAALERWQLVVVVNPVPATVPTVRLLEAQVRALVDATNAATGGGLELVWIETDGPVGWTGAVNLGVRALLERGMPEAVAIINDDVLVTPGWLGTLAAGLQPERVLLQGEAGMFERPPLHGPEALAPVGMVGPCSNEVAGVQQVQPPEVRMTQGSAFVRTGVQLLDDFAGGFYQQGAGVLMAATFLSGLCVLYRGECLQALLEQHEDPATAPGAGPVPCLLRPVYGTGGYDDNDVAVRALRAGWSLGIARSAYVHHLGHRTLDAHFPDAKRGMANGPTFLRAWEGLTDRPQRIVAVYRVRWEVPWDVAMFGASLRRVLPMVDGVAVLATGSPAAVVEAPEWDIECDRLKAPERQLVEACREARDERAVVAALQGYLRTLADGLPNVVDAVVGTWAGQFNERDERNEAIRLGLQLRPDWLFSVDHDEVPEDAITREHLQRLARHPDPGVLLYDVGWLNHWDTPRLCRVDAPYAHGYTSSMRGFRLWRVTHEAHQRIVAGTANGLHCGNVPDGGEEAKRVAALRFRHYGYMRPEDRERKFRRYNRLDPQPDAVLTQAATNAGGYDHIVREEGMQLQPYVARNRIGLTMLFHGGEQVYDLQRHLDLSYGLVEQVVLVWTDPAGTAPSEDAQYVARRFGARWVHHPLNDDLAAARNAGVDALRDMGCDWCWVMDPDEWLAPAFQTAVALRRMAEVTDSWAWMFRFRNHRPDGQFNMSENTRFFRLEGGVLRFNNRVHETLEDGLAELGRRGIHPQVRIAPFVIEHFGLAGGDERTQAKLQRYTRLLVLQIKDRPLTSPGAWTSLGLQFGNDGDFGAQMQCYEVAMATSPHGYLPFREAALYHLRLGRRLLLEASKRLSPAHDLHRVTNQLADVLGQHVPEQPTLGAARRGVAVPTEVRLEELLALVDGAAQAGDDGAGAITP